MSISYHGVVGHTAKVTLPSVSNWGTNTNILRDPPKSITTRKIDKVGGTSEIVQMIQDSGDRITDAITVYPRGVNPMVGVSYNNYGNNAGLGPRPANGGTQAFLPYRVMRDGAFRPPARDQRSLLPLSRLPRIWTSSYTQPGFADFSKKAVCPGSDVDTRGVKKPEQMLKACIRPTATYQIETPIVEPFEVRYVIQNPIKVSAFSGIESRGKFNAEMENADMARNINNNQLKPEIHMNSGTKQMQQNVDFNVDVERYLQETVHSDVTSKKSQNINVTSIEELNNNGRNNIQEHFNIDYVPNRHGPEKVDYIHDELEMKRNLPQYEAKTNFGRKDIYVQPVDPIFEYVPTMSRPRTSATANVGSSQRQQFDTISGREFTLKPTISAGSFDGTANLPSMSRNIDHQLAGGETASTRMGNKVYQLQQERYDTDNNPYQSYPIELQERFSKNTLQSVKDRQLRGIHPLDPFNRQNVYAS